MLKRFIAISLLLVGFSSSIFGDEQTPLSEDRLAHQIASPSFSKNQNQYDLSIDLSKYNFSNIRIHLDLRGYIVIRAIERVVKESENGVIERRYDRFLCKALLPYVPKNDKVIKASWQDGVLRIVMPILE